MENTKTPMKDKETKEFGREWQDEQREKMVRIQFPKTIQNIEQEAERRGYQNCLDDIWEEARGLRSWTEHDGSISSADIEAGLQEAYLSIEDKLKNNR